MDLSFLSCSHRPGAGIASPVLAASPAPADGYPIFVPRLQRAGTMVLCSESPGPFSDSPPKPLLTARGRGGAEAEREAQGFECLEPGQER